MKNSMIIMLALLLSGSQLFGQAKDLPAENAEIRIQKMIDGFSETVSITDAQKTAMKKVMLAHHQERKALGREATREQRLALKEKKSIDMQKALGNPETYQAFQIYAKENRQQHMHNKKKQGARKGEGMRQHKKNKGKGSPGQRG
jgi:hypothetical protein